MNCLAIPFALVRIFNQILFRSCVEQRLKVMMKIDVEICT